MSIKKLLSFLILGLSFLLMTKNCEANDWEYWSKYDFKVAVSDIIKFSVKPQVRFKDNTSNFYYFKTDIGSGLDIRKYFDLAIYYLVKRKKNTGWSNSNVIVTNLKLSF